MQIWTYWSWINFIISEQQWKHDKHQSNDCNTQELAANILSSDNGWKAAVSPTQSWKGTNLGMLLPSLLINFPPAERIHLRWRSNKEQRNVVGVSVAAPSAFFSGENSSSRVTSHTANALSTQIHKQIKDDTQASCHDLGEEIIWSAIDKFQIS